ncbi:MAG: hypothetical protein LQ346_003309 [Caloplaca aetnensis]|nr:MAG: hypothetical protein LQ346_003309 [Caloplaca aetnensis]
MTGRAHLLLLPREIRDQIYEALLDLEVPLRPSTTSATLKQLSPSLFVEEHIPQSQVAGLFNCDRQLRSELSQALSRRSLTYALNLLFLSFVRVDEPRRRVVPDWTSIPALPIIHAKCIQIKLQMRQWAEYRHRPRVSSEYAQAERMTLLSLVGRLFAYGPTFDADLRFLPPPPPVAFVEELEVTVVPMADETGGQFGRYYEGKALEVAEGFRPVLDLLARAPLDGRLGRITLRLGEKVVQRWSVEEDKGVSAEEWERLGWVF